MLDLPLWLDELFKLVEFLKPSLTHSGIPEKGFLDDPYVLKDFNLLCVSM